MLYQRIHQFLNSHGRSLLSFLTVGAIAAVINFSTFSFLWGLLKINYPFAVSVAYVLSVVFHFFANRRFTFKSSGAHFMPQIRKYLVMVGVNYLITLAVMFIVVETLGFSPYLGTISAIAMTVGIGYLMARFWVFHSKSLEVIQGV